MAVAFSVMPHQPYGLLCVFVATLPLLILYIKLPLLQSPCDLYLLLEPNGINCVENFSDFSTTQLFIIL